MVSTGPDAAVQIAAADNLIEAGRVLEGRGIQGNSTDRDRHVEVERILAAYPNVEVVEVVCNWDTGTVQRVIADVFAAQGQSDAIICQRG